jgi:rhamnosyl/mannosyltransferase
MKVLHVYKSYYPDTVGGIEQVIAQLALSLAPLGVESRIYTLSPAAQPRVIRRAEGEVWRDPAQVEVASNPFSVQALWRFREQVRWADVVHYQFPFPFGDLLHLLWARNKPSVVSYQSDVVRQRTLLRLYRPLMDRFLRSVDAVVAASPDYVASSPVLADLHNVRVIPNGIEARRQQVPPRDLVERWRQRVGEGFFLFVGVLRYYKGLHVLLDAVRGLGARVLIAGDGPEAGPLRAQAAALGLDNVEFLGRIGDDDKAALLELARAFVFPSHLRSEAFGMSLVEAAMHSLPMISCEIGTGTSYINLDGETGWTVQPDSPAALRDAMEAVLADPERARSRGRAARARFESLFTAERMAGAYRDLYVELVGRRGGRLPTIPTQNVQEPSQ